MDSDPRTRPTGPVPVGVLGNIGFQRGAAHGKHIPRLCRILARESVGIGYLVSVGTVSNVAECLHEQSTDMIRPLLDRIGAGGYLVECRAPSRRLRSGTISLVTAMQKTLGRSEAAISGNAAAEVVIAP